MLIGKCDHMSMHWYVNMLIRRYVDMSICRYVDTSDIICQHREFVNLQFVYVSITIRDNLKFEHSRIEFATLKF